MANRQQLETLIRDIPVDDESLEHESLEKEVEEAEDINREELIDFVEKIKKEEQKAWFNSNYEASAQYGSEKPKVYYESIADAEGNEKGAAYTADDIADYEENVEDAQKVADDAKEKLKYNKSTFLIDSGERRARDRIKDVNPTQWHLMNEESVKIIWAYSF